MPIIANTSSANTFSAVREQLNFVTKRINQFAVNESTLYANTINANVVLKIAGADVSATFAQNTYVSSTLANTNLYIATTLANTNIYIATKISNAVSTTIQTRNIIPEVDVTYNLGSPVRRFKSLYISGNTIVLGSANLSSTGSTLKVGGQTLASNSYLTSTYIANTTARTLIYDRLQVANATSQFATKATWSALTGTNTALRTLISDRMQVANVTSNYLSKTLNGAASQTVQSNIRFSANVAIQGKLTVTGGITTYTANNLVVGDNMIYLNSNNTVTNPDLGFAGNYNDGTYHHAGFFRDASDNGTWKVFENYAPEPDANVYINTAHATFRLASFAARNVKVANNLIVSGNTTIYGLIANGSLGTAGYALKTNGTTIYWDAVSSVSTNQYLQVANAVATYATKAYAASNTYVNSLLGGGGSTAYEKTFNIVGLFAAPITGNARAVPIANTTITKIQLLNSGNVSANLTVRLNKNGVSVNTYTILSGNYIRNYTGLNIPFTSTDYLTVDVLSGSGRDFSLTISS